MIKQEKVEAVAKLEKAFRNSNVAIFTDYRGLSAPAMAELRRQLKEKGVDFMVVKNTLACLALDKAGKGEGKKFLEGPVSIAFGYDDERIPAYALMEYIRSSKGLLRLKGGLLGERVLSLADIEFLSSLPQREELIAKVLWGMGSPISSLAWVLNSLIMAFITGLRGRMKQLEGGGDGTG